MRSWALLAIVLPCALLDGCSRYYWAKLGSTPEQFTRDDVACANEADASVGLPEMVAYRICLMTRGYVREKASNTGGPGLHRGAEDPRLLHRALGFPGTAPVPLSRDRQIEQIEALAAGGRITAEEREELRRRVLDLGAPAVPARPPAAGDRG